MRLVVTADLHYEFEEYRERVDALAADICRVGGDVVVLAGDTFARDISLLERCLRLFDGFRGEKLLVAGNHDLWTTDGDSFELYDRIIPRVAASCGFHDLDAGPRIIGEVAFVGTIGWYDYSFRDESLGVPLHFYEHKAGPGYASVVPGLSHLIEQSEPLPERALQATSYWMDGCMIRWRLDDRRFNHLTIERLEAQLAAVEPDVRAVVAVTHHIPFAEMLTHRGDPSWTFGNAFMGSAGLGEALLCHEKVAHTVFGHSHARDRRRIAHIDALNVGSTYRKKRYDVIDM